MTFSGSFSISEFISILRILCKLYISDIILLFFKSKNESYCALLIKDSVVVRTIFHFPLSNDKVKHKRTLREKQKAKDATSLKNKKEFHS